MLKQEDIYQRQYFKSEDKLVDMAKKWFSMGFDTYTCDRQDELIVCLVPIGTHTSELPSYAKLWFSISWKHILSDKFSSDHYESGLKWSRELKDGKWTEEMLNVLRSID